MCWKNEKVRSSDNDAAKSSTRWTEAGAGNHGMVQAAATASSAAAAAAESEGSRGVGGMACFHFVMITVTPHVCIV